MKKQKKNECDLIKKVKRDPFYIQYIKNPSEKVQLAAVKQNGLAIQYINKIFGHTCTKNISENSYVFTYDDGISEDIKYAAVKQNGLAIQYIKNPSEKIQLMAVRENNWAINYIKNPFMSVIKACNKK